MDRVRRVLLVIFLIAALGFALTGERLFLPWLEEVVAQAPPPTKEPEPTPTDTATTEPTPTDTATVEPPTNTPTQPPPTAPPATPPVKETKPPRPQPNPNCQSAVNGYVLSLSGERVSGATVSIVGEGWSNAILTDDAGKYGFAGLCAGTATLQATLPGGQMTTDATVDLDGVNSVALNLGVSSAGAAAAAETEATVQPSATPEPEMPETGYSGWMLIGGAFLGVLLLLFAGARRAFGVRE